jgi:hypothetical protein
LENKVRELTSDVEGEKLVTRRVYDQAVRNGDQIGALRSEVATARVDIQALTSQTDHVVGEVVQSTAALRSQGVRLDPLTRDIGLLRNDVTALRRGQEELHARLDTELPKLDTKLAKHDTDLAEVNRKLDVLIAGLRGGSHSGDH